MSNRSQSLQLYSHLYKRLPHQSAQCYYCGEPATEYDHCPPITRVDDYKSLVAEEHRRYVRVPSCNHCNNMLSDSLQRDLDERFHQQKANISKWYSTNYKFIDCWNSSMLEEAEFTGTILGSFRDELDAALKMRRYKLTFRYKDFYDLDGGHYDIFTLTEALKGKWSDNVIDTFVRMIPYEFWFEAMEELSKCDCTISALDLMDVKIKLSNKYNSMPKESLPK